MTNRDSQIEEKISNLFKDQFGSLPSLISKLPNSGSSRIYFRLNTKEISVIGVFNSDIKENIAFVNFTKQFLRSQINVPEIITEDLNNNIYLISDLGNLTLLEWLLNIKSKEAFPTEAIGFYKKVLNELSRMQIVAGKNFDYSHSHPFKAFDKSAILFDLRYFEEKFLTNLNLNYNSDLLNSDFDNFAEHLLTENSNYFMFRDFQARNIMMVNNEPYFIDYQGGRKGALQYDLVSLLFQAKAQIPESVKQELLDYYIKTAQEYTDINKDSFITYYYSFALIRVLQTLGAYGLRGIIEKKKHFIESIPLALKNLNDLYLKVDILNQLPELKSIISQIININIDNKF